MNDITPRWKRSSCKRSFSKTCMIRIWSAGLMNKDRVCWHIKVQEVYEKYEIRENQKLIKSLHGVFEGKIWPMAHSQRMICTFSIMRLLHTHFLLSLHGLLKSYLFMYTEATFVRKEASPQLRLRVLFGCCSFR